MPEYLYKCDCGRQFSVLAPMSEAGKDRACACGQSAYRDWAGECSISKQKVKWPVEIEALGVSPEQIPEAMAADRKAGLNTRYNPHTGAFIAESEKQLAAQAHRLGFVHRQGCFPGE